MPLVINDILHHLLIWASTKQELLTVDLIRCFLEVKKLAKLHRSKICDYLEIKRNHSNIYVMNKSVTLEWKHCIFVYPLMLGYFVSKFPCETLRL